MFSHTTLGVQDFTRAFAFYDPLLTGLGHRLRFHAPARPWAAWEPADGGRPLFVIMTPEDGQPASVGNGTMLALLAPNRATVDQLYAQALRLGGSDAGEPGLRPDYHPDYYGAYLRDPDGNKLCLVCHDPA